MLRWVGRGRWVHAKRSEWSEAGDKKRHGMQICLLRSWFVGVDGCRCGSSMQGVATCPASAPIWLRLKDCLEVV